MGDTCTAHQSIVERLEDFKQWSNQRDEEQETTIQGVSARMDDLKTDFHELKDKVDRLERDLPNTITAKITAYIDSLILSGVKSISKWFFRAIIGGAIVILLSILIRSFFGGP